MKKQDNNATYGPGSIIALAMITGVENLSEPVYNDDPETSQEPGLDDVPGEESLPDSGERVENLPPEQPDVDPLERENPDIDEIEENEPTEQPEIDPLEAPQPDIDEIDPDREPEINESSSEKSHIDRDPVVQPGTDPMKTDNSQLI